MTTKIVFILDRSGSMSGKENDVIGGFNSFISEQKKLKDEARVTTILFDDGYEILHNDVDLQKMEPITENQYYVRGNTALLDAIGRTIENVNSNVKEEDIVLFVINTDGEENSSRRYNNTQIKEMVEHYQEEHGWKFIFLGANIDSFSVGGSLGITYNFNYQNTSDGVSSLYAAISNTTSTYRATKGAVVDTEGLTKLDSQ